MIYFVRSGDAVKIGYAERPDKRIPSLKTANPNELVVLGVMEGGVGDEKELHRRFSRRRLRGEWFELSNEILVFIEEHCRPFFWEARRVGMLPPEPIGGERILTSWPAGALGLTTGAFLCFVQLYDHGMSKLPLEVHVASLWLSLGTIAFVVFGLPLGMLGLWGWNRVRQLQYERRLRQAAA